MPLKDRVRIWLNYYNKWATENPEEYNKPGPQSDPNHPWNHMDWMEYMMEPPKYEMTYA